MNQTTKPEVWPVDKPYVVFLVPAERSIEYAAIMNQLVLRALQDLDWSPDSIELIGLIAATPESGTEGVLFLEEIGVDTRSVTLLMLWGETAECVNFQSDVVEEFGMGVVVLPKTGVILPTVRAPSIGSGWWGDSLHQEYAVTAFANLVRDGRIELDGSEPFVFVTENYAWN